MVLTERGDGADGGHGDAEVEVSAEGNGPYVGSTSGWRDARKEEAQSHRNRVTKQHQSYQVGQL